MRSLSLFFVMVILLMTSCAPEPNGPLVPRNGDWHMVLDLNGHKLPFRFEITEQDSAQWLALIHNAQETITVTDIVVRNDSFLMRMPLFDSEFRGALHNDSLIRGQWFNYLKGPGYSIPFTAHAGLAPGQDRAPGMDVAGTWEVHFNKGSEDRYDAIGMFEQGPDGRATGTFVTETGDYRYLEGGVRGDSLQLGCFDGSHAFLFTACLKRDSLVGRFWSGTHWEEPWVASRNPGFQLRDPDSLTFLREGYEMLAFRFPDMEGRMVSPLDPEFKGKPLMVQVMGSWCPNCVDETILLNEVYKNYREKGLEVIAVAFEKYDEPERALAGLRKFKKTLGVEHTILYGGKASKENTAKSLPFLDHIMSYPTCIFVDRNGMVRRIRTGFYGPGTGAHYEHYRRNLNDFIEELLAEPVKSSGIAARKRP